MQKVYLSAEELLHRRNWTSHSFFNSFRCQLIPIADKEDYGSSHVINSVITPG